MLPVGYFVVIAVWSASRAAFNIRRAGHSHEVPLALLTLAAVAISYYLDWRVLVIRRPALSDAGRAAVVVGTSIVSLALLALVPPYDVVLDVGWVVLIAAIASISRRQRHLTRVAIPAGWQPDPQRRHAWRWWDGTTFTNAVSDTQGNVSEDSLPPRPRPPMDWRTLWRTLRSQE